MLVHYQQASMRLVSAFRRRRRRLRLHRARFRNCPWSRSPRPAELWFEIGTMYFTSLSFYPADLLVAACTTCAGFDNSSGRRATRWSQLFFKLPPVSGLGYESDTRLNSSFPSNENWGSDGQGRKFVSCHRGWKTTLADKNVFFSLLNLSRHVLRTMTVQWFKKQTCLVCQNLEASDAGYRLL